MVAAGRPAIRGSTARPRETPISIDVPRGRPEAFENARPDDRLRVYDADGRFELAGVPHPRHRGHDVIDVFSERDIARGHADQADVRGHGGHARRQPVRRPSTSFTSRLQWDCGSVAGCTRATLMRSGPSGRRVADRRSRVTKATAPVLRCSCSPQRIVAADRAPAGLTANPRHHAGGSQLPPYPNQRTRSDGVRCAVLQTRCVGVAAPTVTAIRGWRQAGAWSGT